MLSCTFKSVFKTGLCLRINSDSDIHHAENHSKRFSVMLAHVHGNFGDAGESLYTFMKVC